MLTYKTRLESAMKLAKAVEILELNLKEVGIEMPTDTRQAVKLGVEGLKALQDWRAGQVVDFLLPLPGETFDGDSP